MKLLKKMREGDPKTPSRSHRHSSHLHSKPKAKATAQPPKPKVYIQAPHPVIVTGSPSRHVNATTSTPQVAQLRQSHVTASGAVATRRGPATHTQSLAAAAAAVAHAHTHAQPQPHTHTARTRRSFACLADYQPGQYGPPIVTTGPPLREEWIYRGPGQGKKKIIYENADVIYRERGRAVVIDEGRNKVRMITPSVSTIGMDTPIPGITPSDKTMHPNAFVRAKAPSPATSRHHGPRTQTSYPVLPNVKTVPLPLRQQTSFPALPRERIHVPHHDIPTHRDPPHIHKVLLYPNDNKAIPTSIYWNVTEHPRNATLFSRDPSMGPIEDLPYPYYSSQIMKKLATAPAHLRLTLQIPVLAKALNSQTYSQVQVVRKDGEAITVGDVLSSIYKFLHSELDEDEVERMTRRGRRILMDGYYKRMTRESRSDREDRRSQSRGRSTGRSRERHAHTSRMRDDVDDDDDDYDHDYERRYMRVDLLDGHTRFAGIVLRPSEEVAFDVHLARE
ncbi:hypothetical protein D9758_014707 [Tetrapyrgos nigripes]|uniref:DUF6699 domain-containing protein n=1 Tax=Tetrapyrgos nigripes TaxID=182062 RepID=A0A8H5FIM3_9AGAR|nr:hypothetical protein D9758_014707 [Tetrapyrgos nigripes]